MSQRDVIDFSALERELQVVVESERRHQRENDAKLRAVSQRASYDQFRDLVLACHMKPLEKKDKDSAPRKQPWNPVARSNNEKGKVSVSDPGNHVTHWYHYKYNRQISAYVLSVKALSHTGRGDLSLEETRLDIL
uniref:Dynein attachment factor N-terminal domain-containing protein n=1 Tax=Oreochromis niloticus TaxID=8128 RepID=A0A669DK74_ORENI